MDRHIGCPEHGRAPDDRRPTTRGLDRAPEDGETEVRTGKQMRPNSKGLQIGKALNSEPGPSHSGRVPEVVAGAICKQRSCQSKGPVPAGPLR